MGVRAEPQRETHVDRAGALPLSPRPAPRRAGLPRRARHLRALQGRARTRSRSPPRATAISSPTGGGACTSTSLSVDRLRADRELIQALPERLKKAVVELNPDRPDQPPRQPRPGADRPAGRAAALAVGRAAGLAAGEPPVRRHARWRTSTAKCRCAGGFDGQQLQSRGELALDSLSYKDCQLTQVHGTDLDRRRPGAVRLVGRSAGERRRGRATSPARRSRRGRSPPASSAARSTATAGSTLGPEPRYAVNATLTDADLARCAQEVAAGRQNLRGKIRRHGRSHRQRPHPQHALRPRHASASPTPTSTNCR